MAFGLLMAKAALLKVTSIFEYGLVFRCGRFSFAFDLAQSHGIARKMASQATRNGCHEAASCLPAAIAAGTSYLAGRCIQGTKPGGSRCGRPFLCQPGPGGAGAGQQQGQEEAAPLGSLNREK